MPVTNINRVILAACLAMAALHAPAARSQTTQPPPYVAIENEVLENIRNQKIGFHTVDDLALPKPFLEAVADRVIRESFQERFRVVVAEGDALAAAKPPRSATQPVTDAPFALRRNPLNPLEPGFEHWLTYREIRPPLPGFRCSAVDCEPSNTAFSLAESATDAQRLAARIIGRTLAREGVVRAAAHAIAALGPDRFGKDARADLRLLSDVGLPADLLRYFRPTGSAQPVDAGWIAQQLISSPQVDGRFSADSFEFTFSQSLPGFRVAGEDGQYGVRSFRFQITRGDDWLGPGDGAGVDILRQVVQRVPEMPLMIHVEERFLEPLLETMRSWNMPNPQRIQLLAETMTVSQWAADNIRPGTVAVPGKRHRELAMLAPRYCSRGEDGSVFVPGDTKLLASLAATGRKVRCSPLHFQGGDLLAYYDREPAGCVLLAGEADIHRNVALGLTAAQAAEALRIEFGADRIEILPAASFHIDCELTIRRRGDSYLALVNDAPAAAEQIARIGMAVLRTGGLLSADDEARAARLLSQRRIAEFYEIVAPAIGALAIRPGQFSERRIRGFSVSAVDSAVGNFQRFLLAIDLLVALAELPQENSADGHTQAYFRSLRRLVARQKELHARLQALEFRVIPVPSLSADRLSINYVNAVHTPERCLLPVYGGLFEPLDRVVISRVTDVFGTDVRVTPIVCAESQRRGGAVHCSIGFE